jgi:hypothetical protein
MHPNVLRYWTEWIVEGDVQSATLVVVTDITHLYDARRAFPSPENSRELLSRRSSA